MPSVLVLGGGLAGLSAAAALGQSGFDVTVLEARPFVGGRATSYPLNADGVDEVVDNCQHILLRCCVNLMDFYRRLGVENRITFHREFYFLEPGGRTSVMKAGLLPAPLHFTESFATLNFLSVADKLAVGRGLLALRGERHRGDLDSITMQAWLESHGQTRAAVERFWRPVLVSAINEELDLMAASHGFQVFWLGFLASSSSYEMGVPNVPLGALYGEEAWRSIPTVKLQMRSPATALRRESGRVVGVDIEGQTLTADHYISALPSERLSALGDDVPAALGVNPSMFEHSPITGIHLWFDRPVTDLPHGALLDRTIQWFFNKREGKYIQLVVSASRSLIPLSRNEVIDLALRELCEFLPDARRAKLERAHVVKEVRATFSARPGLEAIRPPARSPLPNLSLAGDWTRSGWPATMEGAVRSGYLAAEDASRALGLNNSFCLNDIA